MSNLLENMNAPVFTVDIDGGSKIDTSNIKNAYILYFYPKDDTPWCTKEAIEFSENSSYFKVNNITVIGISKDTVVKHDKFKLKHDLKIITVSQFMKNEIVDFMKISDSNIKIVPNIINNKYILGNVYFFWYASYPINNMIPNMILIK